MPSGNQPVISINLEVVCQRQEPQKCRIRLESGDVILFGRPCRQILTRRQICSSWLEDVHLNDFALHNQDKGKEDKQYISSDQLTRDDQEVRRRLSLMGSRHEWVSEIVL